MWSVTASLLFAGTGYTKSPTYSLKESAESFFLEKKSGGGKQRFPSGEIGGFVKICPGLM